MGCLYWLLIGWWYEPFKIMLSFAFKMSVYSIEVIFIKIPACIIRAIFGINNKYEDIDFDLMDGQEFEEFCANILKRNGFWNVRVTKASGDHGVDILADKDGRKYAIQCKCYSNNVGNKAVQEAYSGKTIYKADIAVVLTNSYFTNQAIEDAKTLGVELWDRNKLLKLVNNPKNKLNYKKKHLFNEEQNETHVRTSGYLDSIDKAKKHHINKVGTEEYMKLCKEEYELTQELNRLKKELEKEEIVRSSEKEIKDVALSIYKVLLSYGIEVEICNIELEIGKVVYNIIPGESVRVKTILSYKPEISLALGTEIDMKILSEKGCIGLFIPNDCIVKMKKEHDRIEQLEHEDKEEN